MNIKRKTILICALAFSLLLASCSAGQLAATVAPPGSVPGREALKQFVTMFRAAFSDTQTTVDDAIAEGDKVAWRWTFRGTHTSPFMGIPATGKAITLTGITIDRVVGNQIVERWNQADFMGMMQQLSVTPAPQAS